MTETHIFAIVLLPLLAAFIGGVFGRQLGHKGVMTLTCAAVTVSAVLSFITFIQVAMQDAPTIEGTLYTWIQTANLSVDFGVFVDKLTATMLLVVTSVSMCVHYYSIGYMSHDPHRARFFSYLSLFTFAMLVLVTAPNLLQMFVGWEGVGLASYLLIGFWFKKESANAASMKAFIVNRVADACMLIGLFTIVGVFGTMNYSEIFETLPSVSGHTFSLLGFEWPVINWIALLLFLGAMGKSAQFGFHTWLPDAMEGPTPVSALIHAATMVTAGVFLVSRMSPLFELADTVLLFVAAIGAFTALFAATIGLVQTDIKRVIAYSTCSQLGYMFFACGVGAYHAAMFHLTTHAFFKALLFLGAGSVIHAMHDEQDMMRMGALKKMIPITYGLMWIGSLALAGIPPFAGFFSKDLVLEAAFMSGGNFGQIIYAIGTFAAFLTAFYSFRVIYLSFHGEAHDKKALKAAHESPSIMLAPMYLLAVGAIVGGYLLKDMTHLHWWHGAIVGFDVHALHIPKVVKFTPLVFAVAGILLATVIYLKKKGVTKTVSEKFALLYRFFMKKWYIDELYNTLFVQPTKCLAQILWKQGDVNGIDAMGPNGAAGISKLSAQLMSKLQTGYVYHYAFVILVGVVALVTFWTL